MERRSDGGFINWSGRQWTVTPIPILWFHRCSSGIQVGFGRRTWVLPSIRLLRDLSAHGGGTGKCHLKVQLSAPTLLQASAVLKFRSEAGHAVCPPCANAWRTPISPRGLDRGLGVVTAAACCCHDTVFRVESTTGDGANCGAPSLKANEE